MAPRLSLYLRRRMRQRRIPEFVVLQVFSGPDRVELNGSGARPDREIRWRVYDAQRVEIVVDLTDDTIVRRVDHAGESMNVEHDRQHDLAYFAFSSVESTRQVRLDAGRIVDYGPKDEVVGVEFISPSRGINLAGVPRA